MLVSSHAVPVAPPSISHPAPYPKALPTRGGVSPSLSPASLSYITTTILETRPPGLLVGLLACSCLLPTLSLLLLSLSLLTPYSLMAQFIYSKTSQFMSRKQSCLFFFFFSIQFLNTKEGEAEFPCSSRSFEVWRCFAYLSAPCYCPVLCNT